MVCKDMTFASWQFRRPHQKSHLFYRDCIMSGGAVPQTKIRVEKSAALKSAADFFDFFDLQIGSSIKGCVASVSVPFET